MHSLLLLEKLEGLKVNMSPGPVGPHPRVPKEAAVEIVEALEVIFQELLVMNGFGGLENRKCNCCLRREGGKRK